MTRAPTPERTPAPEDHVIERIREALRGLTFGQITLTVHGGQVVQVERTEKIRLTR